MRAHRAIVPFGATGSLARPNGTLSNPGWRLPPGFHHRSIRATIFSHHRCPRLHWCPSEKDVADEVLRAHRRPDKRPEALMADDPSGIRPGEVAVVLPEAFDAGVYFIGRIRTPWKTRDE